MPLLDALVQAMQEMEFGVFSFDHEGGSGQYEFDFAHDGALATCDKLTLLRIVSKQVAKAAGGFATFMPKPASGMWGSGAHFNVSLEAVSDGTNQFVGEPNGSIGLSWTDTCRAFVAGLATHARALAAITCPTVNSYKRLVPSLSAEEISSAPTRATYGENDRACMLRLPRNRPAVENRAVDAAANPYLAAAFCLAAGMDGIVRDLDPDEVIGRDEGALLLPRTLKEAIDAFQQDPLVQKTFPANFVDEYVAMKQAEWNDYHTA